MVSLSGTLDSLVDLVALFFTSRIPGLWLGKAQFSRITDWLQKPFANTDLIYTPHEHPLQTLHDKLCPFVFVDAPEQDWFPFVQLFRNKAAHMGSHMFQSMSMQDQQGLFYTFSPGNDRIFVIRRIIWRNFFLLLWRGVESDGVLLK